MKFKIQHPSNNLKGNMFDGHILHLLLSRLNGHAAIPGVSTEYILLLSKLIYCVIIVCMLR